MCVFSSPGYHRLACWDTHVILVLSLSSLGGGGKKEKEKVKRRGGTKRVILTQLSGSVAMGGLKTRARVVGRKSLRAQEAWFPPLCPPEEAGCPVIRYLVYLVSR